MSAKGQTHGIYASLDAEILRLASIKDGFASRPLLDYDHRKVQDRTYQLRAEGKLYVAKMSWKGARYFSTEADAQAYHDHLQRTRQMHPPKPVHGRLDPNLPAIVPPGVKITKCPGYVGRHEIPDPGERVISGDWVERRQSGSA